MARVAIAYPPLVSEKGVALLTQNRQVQWFSRPTYIFPVVPATAATMLKQAGHEVLFLDGIAAEMDEAEFERKLADFRPDYVVVETKTPVVKRHWRWIAAHEYRVVMVGDHVTALPQESLVPGLIQSASVRISKSKANPAVPGGSAIFSETMRQAVVQLEVAVQVTTKSFPSPASTPTAIFVWFS